MSGFVVAIRREWGKGEEILGEARTEQTATSMADRVYSQLLLDSVAVIEVDSKDGIINAVYKRERKCKHPNVQFTLTETGVHPVCCGCSLVMEVNTGIGSSMASATKVASGMEDR